MKGSCLVKRHCCTLYTSYMCEPCIFDSMKASTESIKHRQDLAHSILNQISNSSEKFRLEHSRQNFWMKLFPLQFTEKGITHMSKSHIFVIYKRPFCLHTYCKPSTTSLRATVKPQNGSKYMKQSCSLLKKANEEYSTPFFFSAGVAEVAEIKVGWKQLALWVAMWIFHSIIYSLKTKLLYVH